MAKRPFTAILTALFLVSAIMSFGYAFIVEVSPFFGRHRSFDRLASVIGVSVGVPPNSVNTAAEQLRNKELTLAERERAIAEKEAAFSSEVGGERRRDTVYLYLFSANGALLFLILLNFYFDHEKMRRLELSQSS